MLCAMPMRPARRWRATTTHCSEPLAPNARRQLLLEAGARDERRLEAVSCTPWLGAGAGTGLRRGDTPRRSPPGRRAHAVGAHRRAGHAHLTEVPGGAGPRLGCLDRPPPASSRQARPTRATRTCGPRARCHAQKPGGGATPAQARWGRHRHLRHGDATRAQDYCDPATQASACRGGRLPWPEVPPAGPRRACMRWRSAVPRRVVLPVGMRRPFRDGRVSGLGHVPRWFCLPRPWRPTID